MYLQSFARGPLIVMSTKEIFISSNSEADASGLLENLEEIFPRYYTNSDG